MKGDMILYSNEEIIKTAVAMVEAHADATYMVSVVEALGPSACENLTQSENIEDMAKGLIAAVCGITCLPVPSFVDAALTPSGSVVSRSHKWVREDLKGKVMSDGTVYNYRRHRRYVPFMDVTARTAFGHIKCAIHAYRTMKHYPDGTFSKEEDVPFHFMQTFREVYCDRGHDPMLAQNFAEFVHNVTGMNVYKDNADAIARKLYNPNGNKWSAKPMFIYNPPMDNLLQAERAWHKRFEELNIKDQYSLVPDTYPSPHREDRARYIGGYGAHSFTFAANVSFDDLLAWCKYPCKKDKHNYVGVFKLSEGAFESVCNNVHKLYKGIPENLMQYFNSYVKNGRALNHFVISLMSYTVGMRTLRERCTIPIDDRYDVLTYLLTHESLDSKEDYLAYKQMHEFKEIRAVVYGDADKTDVIDSAISLIKQNRRWGENATDIAPGEIRAKLQPYVQEAERAPYYQYLPKKYQGIVLVETAHKNDPSVPSTCYSEAWYRVYCENPDKVVGMWDSRMYY